jgi:hypothetical protein
MKVAVPLLKHSPRFGQEASSQTEASRCSRNFCRILFTLGETGIFTRIQGGFSGSSTVGITLTGIQTTLSAPRSFLPSSSTLRRLVSAIWLSSSY